MKTRLSSCPDARLQDGTLIKSDSRSLSLQSMDTRPAATSIGTAKLGTLSSMSPRVTRLVLWVLAVVFLMKCAMALFTYGTLDVTTWRADVVAAKTVGVTALYREGVHYAVRGVPYPAQLFSHPPSMIHVLRFWDALESLTRLPLQFWMRLCCALADLGTVLVIWKLSLRSQVLMIDAKKLILLAACPISIMVSGFHGNTDPIMVFFLVLSVYFVQTERATLAGILFGSALCIKIVPVIYALCFVLNIGNVRARARFVASAGMTFALAGM